MTRDGIDWEEPDPDDPWSNIGYWGDHQIVYLLRLIEETDRYLPGALERLLNEAWFSYSDVPYRIAPYDEIVRDPKATIRFDLDAATRSAGRVDEVGGDGRLLWGRDREVYLVTLMEKLLVPALAKLSNYVPGGGIWMNTQRPEWNDANNALVGFGLSMVTLYQLRAVSRTSTLRLMVDELQGSMRDRDVYRGRPTGLRRPHRVLAWRLRSRLTSAPMTSATQESLLDSSSECAFSEYRSPDLRHRASLALFIGSDLGSRSQRTVRDCGHRPP